MHGPVGRYAHTRIKMIKSQSLKYKFYIYLQIHFYVYKKEYSKTKKNKLSALQHCKTITEKQKD